jgi:DNA replication protein DnaC
MRRNTRPDHAGTAAQVERNTQIESWHDYIAHPTIADAVLERLVHNAHKLQMKGPSRRMEKAQASL